MLTQHSHISFLKTAIVIPVYNGRNHLDTIWAALSREQLGNKMVIIFVDDGSTDSTKEYLESLAETSCNCNLIALGANRGQAAARNAGINYAKELGVAYITFLDVDDTFEYGYIDNLINKCTPDVDVLVGPFVSVCDGVIDPFNGRDYLLDNFGSIDSHKMLSLLSMDQASVSPCNKLIRLSKCTYFPTAVKEEDTLWAFQLFSKSNLVVSKCSGPAYKYIISQASSTRKFDLRIFDSFWILPQICEILDNNYISASNFKFFWITKVVAARLMGLSFILLMLWMPIWVPRIIESDISLYWRIRTICRIILRSLQGSFRSKETLRK
jgi:glycosyltransferase involved in cell wall biosynthesis